MSQSTILEPLYYEKKISDSIRDIFANFYAGFGSQFEKEQFELMTSGSAAQF